MSLSELMIALSLGTMVLAAGLDLLSMGVRNQVYAVRQTRLQGDAFLAWRAVETELRQSTAILSPGVGATSDVLTGCDNYDPKLGVLDPAAPVASFVFCESGGNVYYYRFSPTICPMIALPVCGSSGGTVVAGGVSHLTAVPAYFSRPAPGLVRFSYQTAASGQSQPVDAAVAFNAAAGVNQ